MTREEYLQKMQQLREEQQDNAKKNRETLDTLSKEHVNNQRDEHTARQHDIERRMNDLKMEWYREHPILEVTTVD